MVTHDEDSIFKISQNHSSSDDRAYVTQDFALPVCSLRILLGTLPSLLHVTQLSRLVEDIVTCIDDDFCETPPVAGLGLERSHSYTHTQRHDCVRTTQNRGLAAVVL